MLRLLLEAHTMANLRWGILRLIQQPRLTGPGSQIQCHQKLPVSRLQLDSGVTVNVDAELQFWEDALVAPVNLYRTQKL